MTDRNILYIVDDLMGRLGKNLLIALGPRLGFYCKFYFPIENQNVPEVYPSSGSYTQYPEEPNEEGWMFITGLISYDRGRVGNSQNDPPTTEVEKKGYYYNLLPLGTKVVVKIPGNPSREADLKITRILQDPTRTRSFYAYILEPIV